MACDELPGTQGQAQEAGLDLHYGHPRMPLSERAKIFVPFDPLKGFREALEEQERLATEGVSPSGQNGH